MHKKKGLFAYCDGIRCFKLKINCKALSDVEQEANQTLD